MGFIQKGRRGDLGGGVPDRVKKGLFFRINNIYSCKILKQHLKIHDQTFPLKFRK